MAHSPIPPEERIEVLDVLRGFALLGILLSNMKFFSQPIVGPFLGLPAEASRLDTVAVAVVRFAVEGKFYTLFSLLFGFGLFVQMTRAEAHGVRFGRLYARRLLVLGVIGAAHAFLLWSGDILTNYAVLGFVLLAFRNRRPRTVLIGAAVFLLAPLAVNVVITLVTTPGPAAGVERAARLTQLTARAAHDWHVYLLGTFADVTAQRVRDYVLLFAALPIMVPGILCMFLTGLWVARRGLLHDLAGHRRLLAQIFAVCLPLGLAAAALLVVAPAPPARGAGWRVAVQLLYVVGDPLLCVAYAAGIALLVGRVRWRRWLAPLGAAGRMALTNYLMQSLVCTTLFYGYGFGLLGRVGAAGGAALAIGVWSAQLALSTLWLRRFRYGPAEWLWRSLTYLRAQPMRQRKPAAAMLELGSRSIGQ